MQYRLNNIYQGMTLIELIVTISILTIATTALMTTIRTFYINNAFLLEQTSALESARRGMGDTVRIIREATYGDDGSYPITAAATSSMTLYADVDGDLSVERVRYSLIGTTLFRTVINPTGNPTVYLASNTATSTIAVDVRNTAVTPLFTYNDDAGNPLSATLTPVASVRSIRVMLLVDLNPTRAPNVYTLSQTATLRNAR